VADQDWRALHFEPLSDTLVAFGFSAESHRGTASSVTLDPALSEVDAFNRHGDTPRWRSAVDGLPGLSAVHHALDHPIIEVGDASEIDDRQRGAIRSALDGLRPWRKGPFRIFGLDVDAEWRSDTKWSRVERAVGSLAGHRVLDVGCGNGYYCLRALGAGAASVLGVEPNPLFVLQFEALRRLLPPLETAVIPISFEALPAHPRGFDTVFSMGVLYHRKSPREHLNRLVDFLAPGGQLVLETLIVEAHFGPVLEPRGRYANMGNVWSIPSIQELLSWLDQAGLGEARVAEVAVTSSTEQRATPWSNAHSLRDALDPKDETKTVEGYPAPRRALLVARR